MSAAEAVLRVLEELRQTALTEALGQVTCANRYHYLLDMAGSSCASCGAVV